MDSVKTDNERELTSTMGNVLSMSSKDEKNDTSDATPTSSTDANTTSTASRIVSDDPISSTSSDVVEQNKSKTTEANIQNSADISQTTSDEPDKSSSTDPEADLLEMSIANVPNEKITEDVEDLVHDLESLLGEPTDSFNVPIKRKDERKSDIREIVNQPQTSTIGQQEVLSSGDPSSSKTVAEDDATKKNTNSSADKSIGDILPTDTQEDGSLEEKPEQEERCVKNDIDENSKNNVDIGSSLDTEEGPRLTEVPIEPQPQDVETEEKSTRTPEKIEAVTETVIESSEMSKCIDVPEDKSVNLDTDNETVETQEHGGDSKVDKEVPEEAVGEISEENKCAKEAESNEATADKIEDVLTKEDEDRKKEAEKETIATTECIDEGNTKDNIEQVQEVEKKIDLKESKTENVEALTESEEKVEGTAKGDAEDKYRNIETIVQHEELKVFNVSEEGPSGDHKLEEEEPKKVSDEMVTDCEQKSTLGDVKTENSSSCITESHDDGESLKDDKQLQEELTGDISEVKELSIEDPNREAESNASIIEENREVPKGPLLSTDKDIGNDQEKETTIEYEEHEPQTEAVSNIEMEEDKEATVEAEDTAKPVSQNSDMNTQEEVTKEVESEVTKEIVSSQEKLEVSDCIEQESHINIPDPALVPKVVPEEDESKPEVADQPQKPAEETSKVDCPQETPEETETMEILIQDVTYETSSDTINQTEVLGIVVEPEDAEEVAAEDRKEPDPDVVEITEEELSEEMCQSNDALETGIVEEPKELEVEQNVQMMVAEPANDSSKLPEVAVEDTYSKEIIEISEIPKSEVPEEVKMVVTPEPESVSEIATEQEVIESQEKLPSKSVADEKCGELEIPQSAPEAEEGKNLETDKESPKECEKYPEMQTDSISEIVDVPDSEVKDEIPKAVDETQNSSSLTVEVDEETTEITAETSQAEEIPTEIAETPSIADAVSETVDETPSTTDETPKPIDETPKPIDEPTPEPVKEADDDVPKPMDDLPTDSSETLKADEETACKSQETSEPVADAVAAVDETIDSHEATNDETPSSSNEIPNADVAGGASSIITGESANEQSEAVDEATKSVDEAVEVIQETLQLVEEISELEDQIQKSEDDIAMDYLIPETEEIQQDENAEIPTVPDSNSGEVVGEQIKDNNRVIEISDDDSKQVGTSEGDYIQVLSSGGDSDSEEMVPVLALEPDENNPSPKEPIGAKDDSETERSSIVHSMDVASVAEPLPEIEDILADQSQVDEAVASIDMQENLETILAVASLQNADSTEVETVEEPQISEKERREMEALRKAVESITENTAVEFEEEVNEVVGELINDSEIPIEETLLEPVAIEEPQQDVVLDAVLNKTDVVISREEIVTIEEIEDKVEDKEMEQIESDTDQDVPELRIEDSEDTQDVDENVPEESAVAPKVEDTEVEEVPRSVPDTSEDSVMENEVMEVLPDSSQVVLPIEEAKQTETPKESRTKSNERPRRHKKSLGDNKLEELTINVDVPDKEKPYSPKVTIKPIKVPDDEVSTTSNSDSEVGKGSLKMTITKQSDKMHSILKICDPESSEAAQEQDEPIPKLIIKPKMQQVEQQHSPKMSTRSSRQVYSPTSTSQRSGSPRITIKPVVKPDKPESVSPLKIKIKPEESAKKHNPKLNIKPVTKPEEETSNIQTARKVIIKPVKPPEEMEQIHSPRITIKPIPKPETEKEPMPTTPRLNIKPIKKQDEEEVDVEKERSSPKITIKPIVKPQEPDTQTVTDEEEVKERIVLKINKGNLPTPTKDSKKREHPPDEDKSEKLAKITVKFSRGGGHPHIVQQPEESNKRAHEEQATLEKVKKQKTEESTISTRSKHKENLIESPVETRSKHKETSDNPSSESSKQKQKETDNSVHESTKSKHKDPSCESPIEPKRAKLKDAAPDTPIYESTRSRHRDEPSVSETIRSKRVSESGSENPEHKAGSAENKADSPIVISEDSRSQDSGSCVIVEEAKDPLASIPVFEIRPEPAKAMTPKQETATSTPTTPLTPTPRKRGRPRKVPIVVREEFKEQEEPKPEAKQEEQKPVHDSGRPKRSCRGQSVRATLGIKPRKPRGPGRGRGSKRGMGTRAVPMKPEGEPKLSKAKLKLMQVSIKQELAKAVEVEHEKKPVLQELLSAVEIKAPAPVLAPPETSEVPASPLTSLPVPSPQAPVPSPTTPAPAASPKPAIHLSSTAEGPTVDSITPSTSSRVSGEIVMVDEETRMSADTNSRAQTPAKQVAPADAVIEESQSSVQSTATTESGKAASSRPNKAPRLEVQEPEGAVISADQLTEYYWNGNGPFMLQEQVAQFLGIKSFKRKYPGIMRRMLDMQERDFIRESGLASEHMCDLGLTAVNSADILDIMYSDFQDKYEEYCKHQRDRQAKDLINKQKALSLAASQEKNKADITEQAVQSAAQWNASFNKARKEQRKACMDLQTLTVHYPKGKMKQINKGKVGNYPVALVPGQFTDYYKEFTPTEINNLPLNTMCYDPINIIPPEESEESGTEGSDSDSDSSSSSSGSGSDSSSGVEDCKLCKHSPKKVAANK